MMRVVAIDGPAGSGKSTVSRAVAAALGLEMLDSGAMYRAATLAVLRSGLDLGDTAAILDLLDRSEIEVGERILLDGEDVSAEIRTPEVTAATSGSIAANPDVRTDLIHRQRDWMLVRGGGDRPNVVKVGRPVVDHRCRHYRDVVGEPRRHVGDLDFDEFETVEVGHTARDVTVCRKVA